MKKNKLNISFHNPNTNEETVKYISTLFAEVAVVKVKKAQEINLENQKKTV